MSSWPSSGSRRASGKAIAGAADVVANARSASRTAGRIVGAYPTRPIGQSPLGAGKAPRVPSLDSGGRGDTTGFLDRLLRWAGSLRKISARPVRGSRIPGACRRPYRARELHRAFRSRRTRALGARRSRHIPPQEDIEAEFGNPPVTLWNSRRFFVSPSSGPPAPPPFTSMRSPAPSRSFKARASTPGTNSPPSRWSARTSPWAASGPRPSKSSPKGRYGPSGRRSRHSFALSPRAPVRFPGGPNPCGQPFRYSAEAYPPGLAIWDQRHEPAQLRSRQFAKAMLGFDAVEAKSALSAILP